MSTIVIGKTGNHNVTIDLNVLLSTRALLTADSGGGKTFALKRIIEQAFGKIQIIVIDPEGEFAPMREKLDFVLVGKGGLEGNTVRIKPPLCLTEGDVDRIAEAFDAALRDA